MKGLFREKLEYLGARFNTKEGLFEFLIGSFIWGYIVVNYKDRIYDFIFNFFKFIPYEILRDYLSYLGFGLFLLPLGIFITYILTKIYRMFFKNGRII